MTTPDNMPYTDEELGKLLQDVNNISPEDPSLGPDSSFLPSIDDITMAALCDFPSFQLNEACSGNSCASEDNDIHNMQTRIDCLQIE